MSEQEANNYADTPEQGREAIDALACATCSGCGNSKARKRSLCGRCFGKLPGWLQTQLYRVEGYGRTFACALAYLKTPFAARQPHPEGVSVGATGWGWRTWAEDLSTERVRVQILEIFGPVLRVEFCTSADPKWRKKVMLTSTFTPDGHPFLRGL